MIPEFFCRVSRLCKWTWKNPYAPVAAEVIPVESDIGAVRVLKALFRFKGKIQGIAVDHFRGKVVQIIVKIGVKAWRAIPAGQFHLYIMVCVKQIILFFFPRFRAAKVSSFFMSGTSVSMSNCCIHSS